MFICFTGHSTSKKKAKAGTKVMDLEVRTEAKAVGEQGRTCPQRHLENPATKKRKKENPSTDLFISHSDSIITLTSFVNKNLSQNSTSATMH